jgi:putative Holliday junction resolvase
MQFPVLALDHGLKHIGVALSLSGQFAQPLAVITRTSKAADFAVLRGYVAKHQVSSFLVGLPPRPPAFIGISQQERVLRWVAHLAQAFPLPIFLWDEGLSSQDATALLLEKGERPPHRVDAQAAALILQTCLEALREGTGAPFPYVPPLIS